MTPEQEVDLRMAEPDDGNIVRLEVAYPESPKNHVYAAIGFDGTWYLSGVSGSTAKWSWNGLIDWFKKRNIEVISLKQATSWEDLA